MRMICLMALQEFEWVAEAEAGWMRALAAPRGCVAFDRLVQEFRRTTDPQVAAKE